MTLKRNTVFEDVKIEKNGISIQELPFVEKINLRGDTKDRDFMSNAGAVLDILIPTEPNTKIQNKDLQVIWLSPNEWLLSFLNENQKLKKDNKSLFTKKIKLDNSIVELKQQIIEQQIEIDSYLEEIKKLKDKSHHGG